MSAVDAARLGGLLLVAALIQVSLVTPISVASGHPDVVLVFVVALALLRGPLTGSAAGFLAGLLLDVASFGSLGLSSLVLTLAGYWSGRFGEATTRTSPYPPLIAVAFATVWLTVGSALLHFMLGGDVPAGTLFGEVLLPTLALNLLIAYPLYRLTARLFPAQLRPSRKVPVVA